jgi:exosortase/archaeosortase
MGRPAGTPPEVAAFGKDMFRRSHRYVAPTLAVAMACLTAMVVLIMFPSLGTT